MRESSKDPTRDGDRPSRTTVVVAAVTVAAVVGVTAGAVFASHHPPHTTGAPATQASGLSGIEPLTPTPTSAVGSAAASPLAVTPPLPSPAGPVPARPAAGFYPCYDSTGGFAVCADATGAVVTHLGTQTGPDDISIDATAGYIYDRQVLSDSHGNVEQISRTPLSAGPAQVLVHGPSQTDTAEVSFGSPFASPDGNLLAYGQMTLSFPIPGAAPASGAAGSVSSPVGPAPPNPPARLVQIMVRNLHDLSAPPLVVPPGLVSSDVAAGPLLGWSTNSRKLFLVGPGGKLLALSIDLTGKATAVASVFDPAALVPGCQIARTMMVASGDFFVVASCATSIDVVRVHDGTAQPYGTLLHTEGLTVGDTQVDTTGRLLTLSWDAPPQSPVCVAVDGSATIVGGAPTDIQQQNTPGCINPGGPEMPATSGGPISPLASPPSPTS